MVYQWKSGSCIKANAQAAGEQMEKLAASKTGLTAESLLTANKPASAPLHNEYEWDNTKAALAWRLQQSRHLMNSIITVQTEESQENNQAEPVAVRAFFPTGQSKYEPLSVIVQEKSKYDKLLETALRELQSFRKKYETLKELQPVFNAMEGIK
jgi:hypothetical protein